MAFKVDDQLIGQAGDEARRVWSRCYVDRRMGHHMRWAARFFVTEKNVPLPPTRHRWRPPRGHGKKVMRSGRFFLDELVPLFLRGGGRDARLID